MLKNWRRIEELFHRASELPTAGRGAFLLAECEDDEDVRTEVEALLSAGDSGDELPRPFFPAGLRPGERIGRYEILAACGQGSASVGA